MKVLLLGGTGAMGSHLSAILASDEHNDITVTTRRKRDSIKNISFIMGNAHDEKFLYSLLDRKWDVIVDFMVYNTQEFKNRIHTLLDSCNHYVFLSSSRVYADSLSPISENSSRLLDVCQDKEYLSTDEYALTKARQEDILKESDKSNWTIIRPYITFAENRLQLGVLELQEWLYRALVGHTIVFSEDIASKSTTLTYGYDVARGMASVLGKTEAYKRAFHITSSESMKWNEILRIYLRIIEEETGICPKIKIVSEHPYITDKQKKYQVIYDRIYNRIFDNSAISEFIDPKTFLPTEIGLRKALVEFIKDNKDCHFPFDPRHEGIYDRITGECMNLGHFAGTKAKIKYLMSRYIPLLISASSRIKNYVKS